VNELSLKLVELQVAIPRTQDVGKIQEQLMMRGQHMQDQITSETEKVDKRKRSKVNENNETEDVHTSRDGTPNSLLKNHDSQGKHDTEMNENKQHPYKGNFIDIVG
jgi:hypothetical protein